MQISASNINVHLSYIIKLNGPVSQDSTYMRTYHKHSDNQRYIAKSFHKICIHMTESSMCVVSNLYINTKKIVYEVCITVIISMIHVQPRF